MISQFDKLKLEVNNYLNELFESNEYDPNSRLINEIEKMLAWKNLTTIDAYNLISLFADLKSRKEKS